MNGKRPHIGAAMCSNVAGCESNTYLSSVSRPTGTTSRSAIVRGSRRICQSTRRPVAVTSRSVGTTARKARLRSLSPVSARSSSGVVAARIAPSRIRSRSSHSAASSIEWLETSSVAPGGRELPERSPQVGAQDRIEPDGRLVEHEHRRAVDERGRERHACALAAGERADDLARGVLQSRPARSPRRRGSERRPSPPRSSGGSRSPSGRRTPTATGSGSRPRAAATALRPGARGRSRCPTRRPGRRRSPASGSTSRSRSGRGARSHGRAARRSSGRRSPSARRARRGGARSGSSPSRVEA